ncbi:MAG TPA: dTMP kinase [Coriobacteriia bacterium]|nr:dTMP kinase [Coriobacteriia bacterium]
MITNDEESENGLKTRGRGIFITFEGGEGVGKSTQILLLAKRLEAAGIEVERLREPGGTRIGEAIRAVLLDAGNTELNAISELLLYEAARAQLVTELIEPALQRGAVVLCDRYTDSTVAYQGIARGLGVDEVEQLNRIGSLGVAPDRTILITHDAKEALERATEQGADRLEAEGMEFHKKVLGGFEFLAAKELDRIRKVPCHPEKKDTAIAVFEQVADLFPDIETDDFVITDELLAQVKEGHDR